MSCIHGMDLSKHCDQCSIDNYKQLRDRQDDLSRYGRTAGYYAEEQFYRPRPAPTVAQYDIDSLRNEIRRLETLVQKLIDVFSPGNK